MWENGWMKELITKAKSEYKDINKVFCPYLNDYVYFTMKGFKHLLGNKNGRRDKNTVCIRLDSIKDIADIILKSGTLQEYENIYRKYFSFIAILESNKYKVVIFKDIDNKYKFFSVIPDYTTNIRDKLKIYPKNE